MRPRQVSHQQTTLVTCSDNGKSMTAEVISFNPNQRLVVSLERSIKMEMTYNSKNNLYMAKQSGLEFASKGPEILNLTRIR
jgi:hypothetical protein